MAAATTGCSPENGAKRPDWVARSGTGPVRFEFVYTQSRFKSGGHPMTRSDILALFEKYGILSTPQRLEVAEIIMEKPQHLSADQIIERLREAGSSVSKATVYNTLNLFSEKGIVREVAVDPKHLVYDSTTSIHHHFFNVDTGELVDIDSDGLQIKGLPKLPDGTSAESVELIVRVRNTPKG